MYFVQLHLAGLGHDFRPASCIQARNDLRVPPRARRGTLPLVPGGPPWAHRAPVGRLAGRASCPRGVSRFRRGALGDCEFARRRTMGAAPCRVRAGPRSPSFRAKPAFEHMALAALQVQHFHGALSLPAAAWPCGAVPMQRPVARQHVLQPQRTGKGFGVGRQALAAPAAATRPAWR